MTAANELCDCGDLSHPHHVPSCGCGCAHSKHALDGAGKCAGCEACPFYDPMRAQEMKK